MRAKSTVAATLGLLAIGASACGVPLSNGAQPVGAPLPAALNLPGASSTSTTPTTTQPPTKPNPKDQVVIYLVNVAGQLVGVRRTWYTTIVPSTALQLLALGPSATEKNLAPTDLPTRALDVRVTKSGIAQVDLSPTFGSRFGPDLYLPLAQVTYTLMQNFPKVKGVNFYLTGSGGNLLYNYTPEATTTSTPVTTKTYHSLLAPPPAPSSGHSSTNSKPK
ncbi:MAG: hypothetical protein JWM85_1903 [Acidimicrobiaceae bacterium]|nr:hypothetical protein [Acidimicrobiaceae bacterium]